MNALNYKKIIVKIGTNVITRDDGFLDEHIMEEIVKQVAELKRKNVDIILVSSGAVAAGQSSAPLYCNRNAVVHRQLLAATGQIELMNMYTRLFEDYNYICAQVLATKGDFSTRQHYLNMKNCFEALLQERVIPIVNENDVIAVRSIMFTDNDELAGLISSMLNVDALILLTSVDGLFDGDPEKPESKIIQTIDPKKTDCTQYISRKKTEFGTGGMATKCRIAKTLSSVGIRTHIANGKTHNILFDILDGKKIGTTFVPQKKVSSIKKWIAHGKGYEKGAVYINEGAEAALKQKVCSLLPIGVTKVEGEFEKGDIIRIKNEQGEYIGLGMAQYGSKEAGNLIGKRGGKPIIRYDYLFIEL